MQGLSVDSKHLKKGALIQIECAFLGFIRWPASIYGLKDSICLRLDSISEHLDSICEQTDSKADYLK